MYTNNNCFNNNEDNDNDNIYKNEDNNLSIILIHKSRDTDIYSISIIPIVLSLFMLFLLRFSSVILVFRNAFIQKVNCCFNSRAFHIIADSHLV